MRLPLIAAAFLSADVTDIQKYGSVYRQNAMIYCKVIIGNTTEKKVAGEEK